MAVSAPSRAFLHAVLFMASSSPASWSVVRSHPEDDVFSLPHSGKCSLSQDGETALTLFLREQLTFSREQVDSSEELRKQRNEVVKKSFDLATLFSSFTVLSPDKALANRSIVAGRCVYFRIRKAELKPYSRYRAKDSHLGSSPIDDFCMRFVVGDLSNPLYSNFDPRGGSRQHPSNGVAISGETDDDGKLSEFRHAAPLVTFPTRLGPEQDLSFSSEAPLLFQPPIQGLLDGVMPWTWRTDGNGRLVDTRSNKPLDYWHVVEGGESNSFQSCRIKDEAAESRVLRRLVDVDHRDQEKQRRAGENQKTCESLRHQPASDPFYILEVCAPIRGRSFNPSFMETIVPFNIVLLTYQLGVAPIFLVCIVVFVSSVILVLVTLGLLVTKVIPLKHILSWVSDDSRDSESQKLCS